MMIIGHGEHRPSLEALAAELGVAADVVWAGYHEDDLAAHYRAANVLLFTERGSDEGHRAVLEAMACGVPPVAAPIAGIEALLHPFEGQLIAAERVPESIATTAIAVLLGKALPAPSLLLPHSRSVSTIRAAPVECLRTRNDAFMSRKTIAKGWNARLRALCSGRKMRPDPNILQCRHSTS